MAAPRPLRNPPITEALVDIRIAGTQGIDATALEPLRAQVRERYPLVDERREVSGTLRFKEGRVTADGRDVGFHGLFCRSADGTQLAQFRRNGFTLNRLQPYTGAEQLFNEALELWSRYVEIVKPDAVVRLALRYIDRLELPFRTGENFSRFLNAAPNVPAGIPQDVSDFVTRVVVRDVEQRVTEIVAQKLNAGANPGDPATLILDVDVFKEESLPVSPDGLRPQLEILRDFKNRAFFSLLTDEAVNLYA